MSIAINNLEAVKRLLENNSIYKLSNPNDFLAIVTVMRMEIESKRETDKYPYLKFFADWSLHSEIDRNKISEKIISDFLTHLLNFDNPDYRYNKISDSTFNKFISECDQFFRINNKIAFFKSDLDENKFIYMICKFIYDKPILFQSKKLIAIGKEIGEKIQNIINQSHLDFSIEWVKLINSSGNPDCLAWSVKTKDILFNTEAGYKGKLIPPIKNNN